MTHRIKTRIGMKCIKHMKQIGFVSVLKARE
jgi:hypothetical protein